METFFKKHLFLCLFLILFAFVGLFFGTIVLLSAICLLIEGFGFLVYLIASQFDNPIIILGIILLSIVFLATCKDFIVKKTKKKTYRTPYSSYRGEVLDI